MTWAHAPVVAFTTMGAMQVDRRSGLARVDDDQQEHVLRREDIQRLALFVGEHRGVLRKVHRGIQDEEPPVRIRFRAQGIEPLGALDVVQREVHQRREPGGRGDEGQCGAQRRKSISVGCSTRAVTARVDW